MRRLFWLVKIAVLLALCVTEIDIIEWHVLKADLFEMGAFRRSVIHMPGAIFEHHSIKEGTVGCVLLEDQSFA
jgi:hypothetical protein